MKQKIIELFAFMCFFISLVYISGQYGALECDVITCKQFIIRTGIGAIILALGVVLSNLAGRWENNKENKE